MSSAKDHIVIVAGGTANVGYFVVKELLKQGATVVVPSRSSEKLEELRDEMEIHPTPGDLHTIAGDFSAEDSADTLLRRITGDVGRPTSVLAALGDFVTTPSLLETGREDFERVLEGYLVAHFMAARTFMPALIESGGTYVFVQGPLAFELHPELGTDLISVATAAQHMLFRSLAKEMDESRVQVAELILNTFIRNREVQPGSSLSGEEVGMYAAHLLTESSNVHGESINLRTPEQLYEIEGRV